MLSSGHERFCLGHKIAGNLARGDEMFRCGSFLAGGGLCRVILIPQLVHLLAVDCSVRLFAFQCFGRALNERAIEQRPVFVEQGTDIGHFDNRQQRRVVERVQLTTGFPKRQQAARTHRQRHYDCHRNDQRDFGSYVHAYSEYRL